MQKILKCVYYTVNKKYKKKKKMGGGGGGEKCLDVKPKVCDAFHTCRNLVYITPVIQKEDSIYNKYSEFEQQLIGLGWRVCNILQLISPQMVQLYLFSLLKTFSASTENNCWYCQKCVLFISRELQTTNPITNTDFFFFFVLSRVRDSSKCVWELLLCHK